MIYNDPAKPLKPGDKRISVKSVNPLIDKVERHERLEIAGRAASEGAGINSHSDPGPETISIQIIFGTSGYYEWVEVFYGANESGVRTLYTGSRSGTLTSLPAREVNGNAAVPVGTVIENATFNAGGWLDFEYDNFPIGVRRALLEYRRNNIRIIDGPGITTSIADDSVGDEVELTITAGSAANQLVKLARVATTSLGAGYTRTDNTIEATANGTLGVQDGRTMAVGDRLLLLSNNADAFLYEVTSMGGVSSHFTLVRTEDADSSDEVAHSLVYVWDGTAGSGCKGTLWRVYNETAIVLNTDTIEIRLLGPQGVRHGANERNGQAYLRLVDSATVTWSTVLDAANNEVEVTATASGVSTVKGAINSPGGTITSLTADLIQVSEADGFYIINDGSGDVRVRQVAAGLTTGNVTAIDQFFFGVKSFLSGGLFNGDIPNTSNDASLVLTSTGSTSADLLTSGHVSVSLYDANFNNTGPNFYYRPTGTQFGNAGFIVFGTQHTTSGGSAGIFYIGGINGASDYKTSYAVLDAFGAEQVGVWSGPFKGGILTGNVASTTQVLFSDGGAMTGNANFTFDQAIPALTLGGGGYLISTATAAPSGIPTNSIAGPYIQT